MEQTIHSFAGRIWFRRGRSAGSDGCFDAGFRRQSPDAAFAVDGVIFVRPIGEIDRPVRRGGNGDGAKPLVTLGDNFALGPQRRADRSRAIQLQKMIAPRSHEHSAAISRRQPGRIAVENARGRFPRARHHGQRAGQFAVPSDEWMQAASAVAKLETVVALLHHVDDRVGHDRVADSRTRGAGSTPALLQARSTLVCANTFSASTTIWPRACCCRGSSR